MDKNSPLTGNRSRINKPVSSSRMNPLRRKFLVCQAAVKSEPLSFVVYDVEQARVKKLVDEMHITLAAFANGLRTVCLVWPECGEVVS